MDRGWDESNRPVGYIYGVTPGFAEFEQGEARLTYMGIARKITKASRLGFEFAQIDLEAIGEASEPELSLQVKRIKDAQHIEIGLHLPTDMDLCVADSFTWRSMQDQLKIGAKCAKDTGAKYILFHTSSHPRPNITAAFFGRPEPRMKLVGPDGTNFGDWIEKQGNDLKEWFMAKFIRVLYNAMGTPADPAVVEFFRKEHSFKKGYERINGVVERAEEKMRKKLYELYSELQDLSVRELKATSPEEGIKIRQRKAEINTEIDRTKTYDYLIERMREEVGKEAEIYYEIYNMLRRFKFYDIYNYWKQEGSESEEYIAYLTVAYWVYKINNAIWREVGKLKEDPFELAYKASEEMGKIDPKTLDKLKTVVTVVAAEYIKGHLFSRTEQYGVPVKQNEKNVIKSVYDFCKQNKIRIFIETNMPQKGSEGELRILSAIDHINICKAIDGGANINYCIDFEHLLVNLIDPQEEAEKILKNQPGDGKYITCLHVNAPRPIMGAHAPIDLLSHDMYTIYRFIYTLKLAGMDNSYFIWEMGSYGVRQTAIAFRNIIKALTNKPKPVPPNELSPEFYGLGEDVEKRQRVAVMEHAFDPLRGMLHIPEEEWTKVGEAARERARAREWELEKYR